METLIELLNEYEKTLEPNLQIEWTEVWIKSTPEIVISKKFWFIKRLVENDKIDLEKLDKKAEHKPQYSFVDEEWRLWFKLFEVYEWLLMLLSISDTPIDDLISYLK